ncbi:MAG: amidohydrolase family protein, partial [Planctomycetota bacterium]
MTEREDLVLAARWIVPVSAAPFGPGFIRVREGRIAELGRGAAPAGARDLGEAALMPAFVDAHAHLACGFLKGAPPASGFLSWIDEHVTPRVIAAARDDEERLLEAARDAARELLAGGVGTVGD